jgi:uncharacterized protein (DUF4213/DUF364 family)
MDILRDLISGLPDDVPVRSVLVGAHWTVVCSSYCGMASTIQGEKPHGHEKVRDVGSLQAKTASQLAEYALSDILLEASIGVAAINSLINPDEISKETYTEINAYDVLASHGVGKNVALVGHFPFIPKLRQQVGNLWVIEQKPVESEYPVSAAGELIPQAEVVALTGSTLINHTLDELLGLCQPGSMVLILGPSTPLSPVLFAHGAIMISGTRIVDEQAVLRTVSQGANFQQVEGVKLVTLSRAII